MFINAVCDDTGPLTFVEALTILNEPTVAALPPITVPSIVPPDTTASEVVHADGEKVPVELKVPATSNPPLTVNLSVIVADEATVSSSVNLRVSPLLPD